MPDLAPVALSSKNDQLKQLRRLVRQAKARSRERAFVVDGPTLVADVLQSPLKVAAVFIGNNTTPNAVADLAVNQRAEEQLHSAPIYRVDESVLTAVLDPANPRPVAAVVESPSWSLREVALDRPILVAVELRDPGNVGTLIRTSEAAGCGAVVTVGQSVDCLNPKAVRASAGSIFRLPVLAIRDVAGAVDLVRETGRAVIATVVRPEAIPYEDADLRTAAILVGNEPHGLSLETIAMADAAVTIPMADGVESLNVSAAGAVLAFESARQRRRSG